MTRHDANKKLAAYLYKLVDKYPDYAFGQLLSEFILPAFKPTKDIRFQESEDTLRDFETFIRK